jgi:hypothetical protein
MAFLRLQRAASFQAASCAPDLPKKTVRPPEGRWVPPPEEDSADLRRSQPDVDHHSERPRNRPGLSHPGNAPELPPSGLCSLRRSGPVSEPDPPVPLERRRSAARRLRRVDPSGEAARTCRSLPARCALLAFSPLRLSLPLPWSRLPDSSSHVLARPATNLPANRQARNRSEAAPQSVACSGPGCARTSASEDAQYRPL